MFIQATRLSFHMPTTNEPNHILQVAVPVPLRRLFDYLAPDHDMSGLQPGMRVLVPFGRRRLIGVIMKVASHSTLEAHKLKHAIKVLDSDPLLPTEILTLAEWTSTYYQHPIGEVVAACLPKRLRSEAELPSTLITYYQIKPNSDLTQLTRAPRQLALAELLQNSPLGVTQAEILQADFTSSCLKALIEKNLIIAEQHAPPSNNETEAPHELTDEQQQALTEITNADSFRVFLLQGITGSGKTEVYLQAIDRVLNNNKQVLILIPEIALTPQTVDRFQKRFSCIVSVLHSRLNETERATAWLQAQRGEAGIIIGTRSAIFTPIPKLGMIVVDEEHDTSYKQQSSCRYSARDLAIVRAKQHNITVVLGSATPSFESLHNASLDRYKKLMLHRRATNAQLPTFQVVDLRCQSLNEGLSQPLITEIGEHLSAGNQVLLFINRRGFAPICLCHQCGWSAECTACDAHLIVHQYPPRLFCHHCEKSMSIPIECPECQHEKLLLLGHGTQRIENILMELFPTYSMLRLDRDSTQKKDSLPTLLNTIATGKVQLIVGTQMLAKGHHFPNLTLVGIINIDHHLYSGDFRSLERMGQLITQVSGRAGRAERPGKVILQTHQPQHPLLQCLLSEGYTHFSEKILNVRQQSTLPPYSHLTLLRAQSASAKLTQHFLSTIKAELIKSRIADIHYLGPVPAPIEKKAGKFRGQLLIKSSTRQPMKSILPILSNLMETLKKPAGLQYSLDVDPLDLL